MLDTKLADDIVAAVDAGFCRPGEADAGPGALSLAARAGAYRAGLPARSDGAPRPHHGSLGDRRRCHQASSRLLAGRGRLQQRLQRRRRAPPARGQGQVADPQRPCRRGAARPARHVGAPAVRARDRGRLALRPRLGRHEGGPDRQHRRARCAEAPRAAAGRAGLRAVRDGGGMHRQRRARLPAARLPRRRRDHPRARRRLPDPRQHGRDLVPRPCARPAGACVGRRLRRQRDRGQLSPDPGAARPGSGVERAPREPRALQGSAASGQSQHRQDRRRRLGLVGAGLVQLRLPHLVLSRRHRARRRRARSRPASPPRPATTRSSATCRPGSNTTASSPKATC